MVFACRCVVLALSLILVSTTSRIDDTCTSTETSVSLLGQQSPILPQQASLKKPFRRHIVAIGDLHGDMENAKRVLEISGVVDENLDWSGKVDMLVQTGDIIDRGDDTIVLFDTMDKLRAQAAAKGGQVLTLLGNHEWMNALGYWKDVYPSEIKTFGGAYARQEMILTGKIGHTWAANYTTALRLPLHPSMGPPNTPYPKDQNENVAGDNHNYVDDHPLSHAALSFVHGGLSPTYSNLAPFPTRINKLSASLLRKSQDRKPLWRPFPEIPPSATHEERELFSSDNGPLWYRGWARLSEEQVCEQVNEVLRKTGTRRMIMGHTPHPRITSRCNGKIIIIDTGISRAFDGVLSALSIEYSLVPVTSNGIEKWVEEEVIRALYVDRREILAYDVREIDDELLGDEFFL